MVAGELGRDWIGEIVNEYKKNTKFKHEVKLAAVKGKKADVSSVSPSSERWTKG